MSILLVVLLEIFTTVSGRVCENGTVDIQKLQRDIHVLQEKYENLRKENDDMKESLASIKTKRILQPSMPKSGNSIGFYARKKVGGILGAHQTIEFDHVHQNDGNGYDVRHGHFTAPVDGLYHFSTTVYSYPGKGLNCEMMRNGVNIGKLYAPEPGDASSTLNVVIRLVIDDMVWVRHLGSAPQELNAGDYSSFSGFLISQ